MAPVVPLTTVVSCNLLGRGSDRMRKGEIIFLERWQSVAGYKYIIIMPVEASTKKDQGKDEEYRLLRRKDIMNSLSAGSHVCILQSGVNDLLVRDVLSDQSIRIIKTTEPSTQFDIKKSEFKTFLTNYGTVFGIFSLDLTNTHPICTVDNVKISPVEIPENIPRHREGGFIAGFTKEIGRGLLTILPFFISNSDYVDLYMHTVVFNTLKSALETHNVNIVSMPPKWISAVNLKIERDILKEMSRLKAELNSQQTLLDQQRKIKSILWLKHNNLRDMYECFSVPGFEDAGRRHRRGRLLDS